MNSDLEPGSQVWLEHYFDDEREHAGLEPDVDAKQKLVRRGKGESVLYKLNAIADLPSDAQYRMLVAFIEYADKTGSLNSYLTSIRKSDKPDKMVPFFVRLAGYMEDSDDGIECDLNMLPAENRKHELVRNLDLVFHGLASSGSSTGMKRRANDVADALLKYAKLHDYSPKEIKRSTELKRSMFHRGLRSALMHEGFTEGAVASSLNYEHTATSEKRSRERAEAIMNPFPSRKLIHFATAADCFALLSGEETTELAREYLQADGFSDDHVMRRLKQIGESNDDLTKWCHHQRAIIEVFLHAIGVKHPSDFNAAADEKWLRYVCSRQRIQDRTRMEFRKALEFACQNIPLLLSYRESRRRFLN